MKNEVLNICGVDVHPGESLTLALPTPEIYSCAPMHIPMHIIHGKKAGPKVLVCATLYGDEANGIDIVHRLLNSSILQKLQGTLICIPVMNVYGLINHTRLLPDGHDLANSFPGTEKGSFASRLAHLFTNEVISIMSHCINIRCGGSHMYKYPQVFYHPEDPEAINMAKVFGAPVTRSSQEKTGFFYSETGKPKCPTIIYESGEAHRVDDYSTKIGVQGIIKVLKTLHMIPSKSPINTTRTLMSKRSLWVRATSSGIFRINKKLGQAVQEGQVLGYITNPFGPKSNIDVHAPVSGIISAITTHPHVYEGQEMIEICLYDPKTTEKVSFDPRSIETTQLTDYA
ncbi:MAG: succinylglutamate desuccinylase/aspartoacylase family protein [Simkaniaceae bacterium]|nr:succinylglutamate desuccinylase/aspartoacylase family protein [Simkaniaceae bacterium]